MYKRAGKRREDKVGKTIDHGGLHGGEFISSIALHWWDGEIREVFIYEEQCSMYEQEQKK